MDLKDRMGVINYVTSSVDAIRENKTKIKPNNFDLAEYGLIYIGTPTWAAKPAPAIITMIDKCDLKGKDVILFSTMGSSGGLKAVERMREKIEARGGRMVNSFSIKTGGKEVGCHRRGDKKDPRRDGSGDIRNLKKFYYSGDLMSMLDKILDSYKPLIIIPVIITLISLAIFATGGLTQGIDLKGGSIVVLQLEQPVGNDQIQALVQNSTGAEEVSVKTSSGNTVTVEITGTAADVVTLSNSLEGTASIQSFRSVGPLLSAQSLNQVYWALAFAFIFMSITVFIIFRNFVPSMAVIFAALSDIIIAIGGMSLFGIPLSLASVGALLMLIGYSVDTDILLTTRVLKRREGTINERAIDAMKTGFTMAAAAIGSMVALYLVVVYLMPYAQVLGEIAAVLIIGLVADVMVTWLMNLGILRWYMEGRR